MMQRIAHIMIWLAFIATSVPGLASATPMPIAMNQMVAHQMHHAKSAQIHKSDLQAENVVVKDLQHSYCQVEHKNHASDTHQQKPCCDNEFGCSMLGCADGQPLYNSAHFNLMHLGHKLAFTVYHERYNNAIPFRLRRPPKV